MVNITVQGIRNLLQQAGYREIHVMPDETVTITEDRLIRTTYFPVRDAIKLTTPDDLYGTTNLFTDNKPTIDEETGFIKMPDSFVLDPERFNYLVSYTIESGLKDVVIQEILDNARLMTIVTFDIKKHQNFEDSTDPYKLETQFKLYLLTYAIFMCVISLNEVNAIQGDSNFSITYFSEMSKLWGEGHTVQALMDVKIRELDKLEQKIKMIQFNPETSISAIPSNNDKLQLEDWIGAIRR